ncbi:MAG: hypothetical protein P1U37_10635 [Minwuia sp.]|nr:hypothetical protein [Minwuia sp.]
MRIRNFLASVLLLFSLAACETYTAVSAGQSVPVGEGITVTAVGDWAAVSRQFVGNEGIDAMWTVDGPSINQLLFFSRVESGEPFIKSTNQKVNEGLPTWRIGMTEPDVMEMVEGTLVKVYEAPVVTASNLRPQVFLNSPGFAFEFDMVAKSQLETKGLVIGTQQGGVLRMMIYLAPKQHYFTLHERTVRAIAASARTGSS